MPLKSGKSKAAITGNIQEMMRSFKAKGSIGNTTPKSPKKAQQIAAAAAYSKARKSK